MILRFRQEHIGTLGTYIDKSVDSRLRTVYDWPYRIGYSEASLLWYIGGHPTNSNVIEDYLRWKKDGSVSWERKK